ncbi:MAG: imidazolonepropionase [Acidobacteria bacterium]|nr:MAG: imidazolonepropionase [Acidobacteriota bacterium]PYU51005.1 MAG: imidazolonepropionase [Acidobacteriota bacterium]PYU75533.1 MAG: imidazolonepropionase [Acidobacteriota bacterium]
MSCGFCFGHNTEALADSLLICGASQLLTLRGHGPRRRDSLSNLGLIEGGGLLVRDGLIAAVGTRAEVEKLPEARTAEKIDLGGRVALPGFVDAHTHLIHAASRAEEYELKIAGASYDEIARKGGGILNSVKRLRATTSEALKKRAHAALKQFAAYGTTTLEAKSGYGLDVTSELKILRLHQELAAEQPLEIVSTFLGAHVVPTEYRGKTGGTERYIQLIEQNLLPEIGESRLAEFCDVFCDRGAFTVEQSKQVLQAGRQWGLAPRLHAEQLSRTGATRLAILLRAASCDHLEHVNKNDIQALGKSETVATLLPGCDFHLGLKQFAPARPLIEAAAIVSLATDYNPGTSPTLSMPMILSLACTQLRMTPAEAITAATINAAYALRREKSIGSLEVGKLADLAVFEVADYREIPYYFGVNHCWMTVKRGRVIHAAKQV